ISYRQGILSTIELGDSLTILNPIISPAGDIYDYLWTPAEFLSSDTVRTPMIFPFDSREYTLAVTNANGCQAFADIFVEVDANRNVYIPNVFSPNRDGRNEDFRIFACQGVQNVNFVQIFDRWGSQIFTAENLAPNCLDGIQLWDGVYREKLVKPGVFVYMVEVEFLDGQTLLYRGDVTVLR
ncbi:MAG: gliding motility-associated C-terminal domain-containing protein, partial [Bacteroidota bacterium]